MKRLHFFLFSLIVIYRLTYLIQTIFLQRRACLRTLDMADYTKLDRLDRL